MGCFTSGSPAKTCILKPGGKVATSAALSAVNPANSTLSAGGGSPFFASAKEYSSAKTGRAA